jgi:hypothetical protein
MANWTENIVTVSTSIIRATRFAEALKLLSQRILD